MYNIAICDGDDVTSGLLEGTLKCYFKVKNLRVRIRRFLTPEALARYSGQFDIAFLDADANHDGCVRTGKLLISKNPDVFLYILSDRFTYLDDAMDLKAFRYLSKNIDVDRLCASIDIITTRIKRITFVSNYVRVSLKESDIVCIYSKDRKTYVLTENGFAYPTTVSMKNWNLRLADNPVFNQPHYSYIVNVNYVSSFDGEKIVIRCNDGKSLEIFPSQRKVGEFRRCFLFAASEK